MGTNCMRIAQAWQKSPAPAVEDLYFGISYQSVLLGNIANGTDSFT